MHNKTGSNPARNKVRPPEQYGFRYAVPMSQSNCHVVDGVTAPKVRYAPDPEFTKLARKQKLSGKSVVSLIVGADGKPYKVHVIRSMSEGLDIKLQPAALSLDQKAIEAVQRYRFQPATYKGKAVPVEVHVEVNFLIY